MCTEKKYDRCVTSMILWRLKVTQNLFKEYLKRREKREKKYEQISKLLR